MTLTFERAGKVEVEVQVEEASKAEPATALEILQTRSSPKGRSETRSHTRKMWNVGFRLTSR